MAFYSEHAPGRREDFLGGRFRRLVENARTRPLGWAEAAAEFGYYDQAHLIAEFKEFAGLTPAQFFAAP